MKRRFLLHAAFWLAYWFTFAYTYSRYDGHLGKYAFTEGLQMPARMLATYGAFWCVARLRPSGWVFAGAAAAVLGGGLLNRVLKMCYLVPVWFPKATFSFWSYMAMYDVFDCALAAGTALTARLYFRQQDLLRRESILRAEKLDAELLALKAQLHPHFLFNTINNLYALARIKSDKTAPVALKLAHLLRYVLNESQKPAVSLEQETRLIEDYIALEKLRFDEDRLSLHVDIALDRPAQNIAPLLLLPLVENAFKHGVSEQRDGAFIRISILLKNNVLDVVVENSRPLDIAQGTPGIGLKNLRRQLELLYPGRYDLSIGADPTASDTFVARLQIRFV